MRQVTVTAVSDGLVPPTYETPPVIIDQYQDPTSITFYTASSGDVKVSYADPYPKSSVTGNFIQQTNWDWQSPDLTKFPNGDNFIGQPIRAIYLTNAANGDTLTVIQAGVKG